VLQHTLFTRPQPTPEALSTLIARVTELMGQDRVGAPVAVDSYRPGAFAMQPFAIERPAAPSATPLAAATPPLGESAPFGSAHGHGKPLITALRRCRIPVPVRITLDGEARPRRMTTERRGYVTGAIASCLGPWQTSGEWWAFDSVSFGAAPGGQGERGTPAADGWDREEWDVVMADGTVYRLFRDCVRGGWFIDGTVD
jgi:hypothetical protein